MKPHAKLLTSSATFLIALLLVVSGPTPAAAGVEGLCDESPYGKGTAHEFDPPWGGGACYRPEPGSYHMSTQWGYCQDYHTKCNEE